MQTCVLHCAAVPKSFKLCEKGGKSTPEKQNGYRLSSVSASSVYPDATFLLHERARKQKIRIWKIKSRKRVTGLCLTGISPAAQRDSLEFFPWHTTKDGWRKQSEVLELSIFLCPWEAWPCWISRANACIIWGSWLSLLCSWLSREEWGREEEKETELALIKALQLSLIFTYCAIIIDRLET